MDEVMTQAVLGDDQKVEQVPAQLCDSPLFVVGMFRSGTSLLYALLNQHPQIALMYEGDLAHLPPLFWFPTDTPRWLERWEFWNAALTRHKLDTDSIPDGISDLHGAVRAAYTQYARQKTGATIWGCKSPIYSDELTRLSRTFPNARFIIIWRDLRHICASILKAAEKPSFFRRTGILFRTIIGYREMKVQCDGLRAQGLPVHEICYEDLVRNPGDAMQGICEFLQIPFDPRMASLKGADRTAIENAAHHSNVKTEKIMSSGKSPKKLPPALKAKIDRYMRLWRKQYNDGWPVYPESVDGTSYPSAFEQAWDKFRFRSLQLWYHSTPVVFSFVPLRLWKIYRKLRGRPYASEIRGLRKSAETAQS